MKPWQKSRRCRVRLGRVAPRLPPREHLCARRARGRGTRERPVVTALQLCMSRLSKVSHGEEGREPGRAFNCREVSSQEVDNNSKQSSNKRGPSECMDFKPYLFATHSRYPCGKRPIKNIKRSRVRTEMETVRSSMFGGGGVFGICL